MKAVHSTSNSIGRGRKLMKIRHPLRSEFATISSHMSNAFQSKCIALRLRGTQTCTFMHCRKQERLTDPIDGRKFCGIGKRNAISLCQLQIRIETLPQTNLLV